MRLQNGLQSKFLFPFLQRAPYTMHPLNSMERAEHYSKIYLLISFLHFFSSIIFHLFRRLALALYIVRMQHARLAVCTSADSVVSTSVSASYSICDVPFCSHATSQPAAAVPPQQEEPNTQMMHEITVTIFLFLWQYNRHTSTYL